MTIILCMAVTMEVGREQLERCKGADEVLQQRQQNNQEEIDFYPAAAMAATMEVGRERLERCNLKEVDEVLQQRQQQKPEGH